MELSKLQCQCSICSSAICQSFNRPSQSRDIPANHTRHYHRPSTVSREFRPLVRGRVIRGSILEHLIGLVEDYCCSISGSAKPSQRGNNIVAQRSNTMHPNTSLAWGLGCDGCIEHWGSQSTLFMARQALQPWHVFFTPEGVMRGGNAP